MTEQPETALPDDVVEADDVEPDDNAEAAPFTDDAQQDEDADGPGPLGDTAAATDTADEGTGEDG